MKNRILPEKLIAMSSASTLSEVLSNDKETFKSDLILARVSGIISDYLPRCLSFSEKRFLLNY